MPEREPAPRQQLTIDREAARARSEAKLEELVDGYPTGHRAGRDRFIKVESEKAARDIEKRHLDAIPQVDRRDQRTIHGG